MNKQEKNFMLRDYQIKIAQKCYETIKEYGISLLFAEMRVGKTLTSLEIAKLYGAKNVLFVSKLKALSSIRLDYAYYISHFNCTVINYESVKKIQGDFDFIILDECHTLGSAPKPNNKAKDLKRFSDIPMLFLSGTPFIESINKVYHTLYISRRSPFSHYKNFYKWHHEYGIPKKIYTSYGEAQDYSCCQTDRILSDISHLLITFTQEEAGFTTQITEHILPVRMKDSTYTIADTLLTHKVVRGKTNTVLGDTGVRLQLSLHQIYSGTIITEGGEAIIIDDSKAIAIRDHFRGQKIAIMYCFTKELELIQSVFGDTITTDLEEFNTTDKSYVGQVVSTREGVNLSMAEALIFFNIPFSGTSYTQGRDRMSTRDRKENHVWFVCTEGGIEEKILKCVREKKNYSEKIFQKDYKYIV